MSGCKCIAKEEAFAFEFARWRHAKITGVFTRTLPVKNQPEDNGK
jgi:hypothetical protein